MPDAPASPAPSPDPGHVQAGIGAPAATPEAAEARGKIAALTGDPAFRQRFASGDAQARALMAQLHPIAYPDPQPRQDGGTPGAAPAGDPAGADGKGGPEGQAGEQAGEQSGEPLDISLPFSFGPDTPLAEMKEAHKAGQEIVKALSVEPEIANTVVKNFERSHAARPRDADGLPQRMTPVELQKTRVILREAWGPNFENYVRVCDGVMAKAGPKGEAWLAAAIERADPSTAAAIFQTMVNRFGGER